METSAWRVVPLTATHASKMAEWEYPPPYQRYSLLGSDPKFFTDPTNGYVGLADAQEELVAYRSFGPDGQVPGYIYDGSALDTGGGLRPDLVGRGAGPAAIGIGLAYGTRQFHPDAFRVTVWTGNARALKVVRSLGFTEVDTFTATSDGSSFAVLTNLIQVDDNRQRP